MLYIAPAENAKRGEEGGESGGGTVGELALSLSLSLARRARRVYTGMCEYEMWIKHVILG